jgi:4-hydroxy-tetrahydrodipicolinate synthase
MSFFKRLQGVYAAALTPLKADGSPDLAALPIFLDFLAQRGCHGALLLGTTGEGPSFAFEERLAIFEAALAVRQEHPDFKLLAGTGTPSVVETAALTKNAFDMGMDGVVVLPPYYYRMANDDGLFAWFKQVIESSVPSGSALLGYHIPAVSGVALSLDLVGRLKDAFPDRFAGIKDSSSDPAHATKAGERFGKDLVVLNGNDSLLTHALQSNAAGCITAMTNLFSPYARKVFDAITNGQTDPTSQAHLNACRDVMNRYPPAPPLLKALINRQYGFPRWPVRPPLSPLPEANLAQAIESLEAISAPV